MAIREIIKDTDAILREKSKEVTVFDERLHQLLDDMTETMRNASGCGLAAPQVGVLKRIAIVSPNIETKYEIINPSIVRQMGRQPSLEGCLSIPNRQGKVIRPKRITVEYQDRNGERKRIVASGYLATIFCHEIDHLNGILFTDKIEVDE